MKLKIISILLLACMIGCKKKDVSYDQNTTACGTKNPLANLAWLKNEFQDIANYPDMNGIVLYEYNGEEVINIYKSYYSSTYGRPFYCNGKQMQFNSGDDLKNYLEKRKKIAVLFGEKFDLTP